MDMEFAIANVNELWRNSPGKRQDEHEVMDKYGNLFSLENLDSLTEIINNGNLRPHLVINLLSQISASYAEKM